MLSLLWVRENKKKFLLGKSVSVTKYNVRKYFLTELVYIHNGDKKFFRNPRKYFAVSLFLKNTMNERWS